ncbi:hypothetical protein B0H10DRAFT_2118170 [Mycena sp. CBHHK59/15]|nr:hypothetical protein B0H10DRAFT_2118170 [Mycena sp. CBHHK59/15]
MATQAGAGRKRYIHLSSSNDRSHARGDRTGTRVYITGRRMEALENAAATHSPSSGGGEIVPLGLCDVTSKADLELSAREMTSSRTPASPARRRSPARLTPRSWDALWEKESVAAWDEVFRTNVAGVYFTTVAFLPLLQAASAAKGPFSAAVIVVSSMSGMMSPAQGHFSYSTAEGVTVRFAKMMSDEFAEVRVNQIALGCFSSEMTISHEKVRQKGHVPAERPGSEEEMAQAVLFLARNRYVNGESLAIDGGTFLKVLSR